MKFLVYFSFKRASNHASISNVRLALALGLVRDANDDLTLSQSLTLTHYTVDLLIIFHTHFLLAVMEAFIV